VPGDEIQLEDVAGTTVGKLEGDDNLVGTGNSVMKDNVVVLINMNEREKVDFHQIASAVRDGAKALGAGLAGAREDSDRKRIEGGIDKLLSLLNQKTDKQAPAPERIEAGGESLSAVDLLIRKSILLKTEADEIGGGAGTRPSSGAGIAHEEETHAALQRRVEKLKEAQAVLEQALEREPMNPEVMLHLAQLHMELTPDDPRDEHRMLNRIRKLLQSPKNDEERYCLARATYLMATTSRPIDATLLRDAMKMFEALGKADWVRQCSSTLAALAPPKASRPAAVAPPPRVTDTAATRQAPPPTPQRAPASPASAAPVLERFNPAGSWNVQLTEGSQMTMALAPDGSFQATQVNVLHGLFLQAFGTWTWSPILNQLTLQGMIPNLGPFMFGVFIMGKEGEAFVGVGTDGQGYRLVRA
jgi:hypothetical protein